MTDRLSFTVLEGTFGVARFPHDAALPSWLETGQFVSITRTETELSIVAPDGAIPATEKAERGWAVLGIDGPLDMSAVGILAEVSRILAEAGCPVFAVSTYDTDYVLVQQADLDGATGALRRAGHNIGQR